MKIKLDENLPVRLVPMLQRQGRDVDTVPEEHLSGRPDADIWRAVCAEGRFLITQDMDFLTPANLRPARMRVYCLSDYANRALGHW